MTCSRTAIRTFLAGESATVAAAIEAERLPRLRYDLMERMGVLELPRAEAEGVRRIFGEEFDALVRLQAHRATVGGLGRVLLWLLLGLLVVLVLLDLGWATGLDTSQLFFLD
ncbi:MAG: hypothetical protein ACM31L_00560 [Actinomycetota bacterium]